MARQASEAGPEALYTVTRLAEDLGVTSRTIRFYEDKGLIAPSRAGTTRVYTHRDRARMVLILRGKRLGFSLRDIREFLDLYDADPTQAAQMRKLLRAVRDRLAELDEQRRALDADRRRAARDRGAGGGELGERAAAPAGRAGARHSRRPGRPGRQPTEQGHEQRRQDGYRDRGLRPLALPPRQQGRAGPRPARRPGGPGGPRADRAHRRAARGHRGRHRRLRLPRGRAGAERRAADRAAGGPAAVGRRHDGQPLLRHRRCSRVHIAAGRDRDGRGRGVHLRRGREHEPGADDGLQPAAQPGARTRKQPGAYMGMGDTAENVAAPLADRPRRAGGVRRAQPAKAAAAQADGRLAAEIVADPRRQGRRGRAGRLHPRRTPPPRRWPG